MNRGIYHTLHGSQNFVAAVATSTYAYVFVEGQALVDNPGNASSRLAWEMIFGSDSSSPSPDETGSLPPPRPPAFPVSSCSILLALYRRVASFRSSYEDEQERMERGDAGRERWRHAYTHRDGERVAPLNGRGSEVGRHRRSVSAKGKTRKRTTTEPKAVLQDDADALIWMLRHNLIDLSATDDLGNTAAHLAVFHDSPRVLRLLHELGLDLAATCDAAEFGSAIFYSVMLGRVECLEELIGLGYDMSRPCDRFERTPETVAIRHDQGAALSLVLRSLACLDIQRLTRGFHGRQKAKRIRAAWARGAKTDPAGETSVVDVDGVVAEDGKGVDGTGGELGGSLAGEGGEDECASADDAGNEGITV